jgi:hypothetical protein
MEDLKISVYIRKDDTLGIGISTKKDKTWKQQKYIKVEVPLDIKVYSSHDGGKDEKEKENCTKLQ